MTFSELIPVHLRDAAKYALELADTILTGEGSGSLLFRDLRTQSGYVYDVNSELSIGHQRSTYVFNFSSDPKNAAAAERELLADVRRLQATDVSAAELARAKAALLAGSALAGDSYGGLAAKLLDAPWFPGNAKRNVGTDWPALLRVTPDDVRTAMAKSVRADDFVRASIVPSTLGG